MPKTETPAQKMARDALSVKLWRLPELGLPEPGGKAWPTLEAMQAYVGGYVEHLAVGLDGTPSHLFVNEDGHRLGQGPNEIASVIARRLIVGPALLWVGKLPRDA